MFNSTTFKQFLRFAAVGLTGTAVQYATLALITTLYGLGAALVGTSLGYILGSVVNYILNYFFTFDSGKSHMEAASKYFSILAIGFMLNLGMIHLFFNQWGWWLWMAQMVSTGIGLCWNFGGSKLWAFKDKTAAQVHD